MPVKTSVYSLLVSPDHSLLAAGERSGQVSLYSFEQSKVTAVLNNHRLPVFALSFVNRKNELLAASEDGTVSVVNLKTTELVYQFRVSEETIRCMAVSPDESIVAFGCKDNIIRIFNITDYSLLKELHLHTMPVTSLAFSPDGELLLSGGRDAKLNVWGLKDFELKDSITAHMFAIYDIKFSQTGAYFATASQDKSIKIWSADSFRLLKIISREKGIEAHSHSVNKLNWNTKDGSLISVSDDRMIMRWEIK